jgi:hypothetical protein
MFELLDLEGLLRGGSWSIWLMVFLLLLVFWLVRYVTDLNKSVATVREEVSHTVSPAFLARFTEINNLRQLKRIRDAYRRAASKGGSGRFDLEIQREIDQLKASAASGQGGARGAEDGDLDGYDSDSDSAPNHSADQYPHAVGASADDNDFQD